MKYLLVNKQTGSNPDAFSGSAGKLIRAIFAGYKVEEADLEFFAITNYSYRNHMQDLKNKIRAMDSDCSILFCGSDLCQLLFEASLWAKRSLPFEFEGKRSICSYSPNYVLQNPDAYLDLLEDIKKLVKPEAFPIYDYEELSTYTVAETEDHVLEQLDKLSCLGKPLAFDIETTQLKPEESALRCVGIGTEDFCFIIPANLFTKTVKEKLVEISHKCEIIAHYSIFEYKWMYFLGCPLKISGDTILKHHAIDERKLVNRKLKFLGTRYLNTPNWSEILKTDSGHLGFEYVSDDLLFPYLAHDIKLTARLNALFSTHPYAPSPELYKFIMEAREVLSKMSFYGTPIDWDYMTKLGMEFDWLAGRNEAELEDILEIENFNVRSSRMVAYALFDVMGYPKVNGDSTGKKTLHLLKNKYPEEKIISQISETRQLLSAVNTTISGILKFTDQQTGKLHAEYLQHTTSTGRLSSADPNLQNIPLHSELGKAIRAGFLPPKEYDYVVEADYSQIEVYIAAIISGDEAMLKLLDAGGDIYRKSAAEFFGKKEEDVTDEERQYFKPIILGSLYLRSASAIAEQNNTAPEVEKAKQDYFFSTYKQYYEYAYGRKENGIQVKLGALEVAKRDKMVRSLFGRTRKFHCILKDNEHAIRREAVNAPIQSTASDICLSALVRMYRQAEHDNLLSSIRPWNIIHDAVLVWITEEFKDSCKKFMSDIMLNPPIPLPIKLKVGFKIGKNWGELEKW